MKRKNGLRMFYKINVKIIMLLLLALLGIVGCFHSSMDEPGLNKYQKDLFALNTWLRFTVYGDGKAEEALHQALERIQEIENRMSITIETSDVAQINRNAGKKPVRVNEDTFYVIKKALEYAELSNGLFDISIYPVTRLWGISTDNPRVPTKDEIQSKLQLVDYRKIILDEEKSTVFLEKEGMGLDLGAIAKGYAADEAVRILKEAGVRHALVNLGGNIILIGEKPDGTLWRIGVRDPRMEETGQKECAILELKDQAAVSSGDYERYIEDVYEKTGERYHHIFDPRTGYPAKTGVMGTTVLSSSSIDADALSTIVFLMGWDEGLKLVNQLPGVKALVITTDKEIHLSSGFGDELTITNKEYGIR